MPCRSVGHHRLSRNHGRAGQDAASQDPWRHAGVRGDAADAGGDGGPTASRRSIWWWSTSIPSRRRWRAAPTSTTCIENIDIGGPALIRAAAKNHDYRGGGGRSRGLRRGDRRDDRPTAPPRWRCAAGSPQRAYARTAAYDAAIADWFAGSSGERFPRRARRVAARCGRSALWREPASAGRLLCRRQPRPGVATAEQLQGKELSYNNINDTDAAYEWWPNSRRRPAPSSSTPIPCGVAVGARSRGAPIARRWRAIRSARSAASSPSTARSTAAAAERSRKIFTEVVIAPDADEDGARGSWPRKKNLRVLMAGGLPDPARTAHDLALGGRRLSAAEPRHWARRPATSGW